MKTKTLKLALCLAGWLALPARAGGVAVSTAAPAGFVQVSDGRFVVDGKPYHFVGANLWYGMNLGSQGPGGDRARLVRELDRLKALGVTNLRVMGLSQGPDREPWRMVPAVQSGPRRYDKDLLAGLDFL